MQRTGEFQRTRYGRVAAFWNLLERLSLQPLNRVRNAFLNRLPFEPRNPLIAGCGTGSFPAAFASAHDPPRLTVNDLAPEMLRRTVQRLRQTAWRGELAAIAADMTAIEPAEKHDFIALQFVLTCFPQPSRVHLLRQMKRCMSPHALWLICDYSRPASARMLPLFYLNFFAAVFLFWCLGANEFTQPGDTEAAILQSGLAIVQKHEVAGGLYTAWLATAAAPDKKKWAAPEGPTHFQEIKAFSADKA